IRRARCVLKSLLARRTKKDYSAFYGTHLRQDVLIRGKQSLMPPQKDSQFSSTVVHPLGTEIYTTTQVAQALHLSVRTILRAIKSGKLLARRTGKQFLITREAVQAYWDWFPLAAPAHTAADE